MRGCRSGGGGASQWEVGVVDLMTYYLATQQINNVPLASPKGSWKRRNWKQRRRSCWQRHPPGRFRRHRRRSGGKELPALFLLGDRNVKPFEAVSVAEHGNARITYYRFLGGLQGPV